jgi:hypothetical protein
VFRDSRLPNGHKITIRSCKLFAAKHQQTKYVHHIKYNRREQSQAKMNPVSAIIMSENFHQVNAKRAKSAVNYIDGAPKRNDIICGRAPAILLYGSLHFKAVVALHLYTYRICKTRTEKTAVVRSVLRAISKVGGRFLKYDQSFGKWYSLHRNAAIDKIGHAMRDPPHPRFLDDAKAFLVENHMFNEATFAEASKYVSLSARLLTAAQKVVLNVHAKEVLNSKLVLEVAVKLLDDVLLDELKQITRRTPSKSVIGLSGVMFNNIHWESTAVDDVLFLSKELHSINTMLGIGSDEFVRADIDGGTCSPSGSRSMDVFDQD